MSMVISSSMVIDQIDITDVRAFEPKRDAPVLIHAHRPSTRLRTLKLMEPICGSARSSGDSAALREATMRATRAQLWVYPTGMAFEHPLESGVAEAPNHASIVA
jgi:hypothetical protein